MMDSQGLLQCIHPPVLNGKNDPVILDKGFLATVLFCLPGHLSQCLVFFKGYNLPS